MLDSACQFANTKSLLFRLYPCFIEIEFACAAYCCLPRLQKAI